MDDFDDVTCEEYDAAFPWEQECEAWMAAMEQDYIDECNEKLGILVREGDNFEYHSKFDEFSPFSTIVYLQTKTKL